MQLSRFHFFYKLNATSSGPTGGPTGTTYWDYLPGPPIGALGAEDQIHTGFFGKLIFSADFNLFIVHSREFSQT